MSVRGVLSIFVESFPFEFYNLWGGEGGEMGRRGWEGVYCNGTGFILPCGMSKMGVGRRGGRTFAMNSSFVVANNEQGSSPPLDTSTTFLPTPSPSYSKARIFPSSCSNPVNTTDLEEGWRVIQEGRWPTGIDERSWREFESRPGVNFREYMAFLYDPDNIIWDSIEYIGRCAAAAAPLDTQIWRRIMFNNKNSLNLA